ENAVSALMTEYVEADNMLQDLRVRYPRQWASHPPICSIGTASTGNAIRRSTGWSPPIQASGAYPYLGPAGGGRSGRPGPSRGPSTVPVRVRAGTVQYSPDR